MVDWEQNIQFLLQQGQVCFYPLPGKRLDRELFPRVSNLMSKSSCSEIARSKYSLHIVDETDIFTWYPLHHGIVKYRWLARFFRNFWKHFRYYHLSFFFILPSGSSCRRFTRDWIVFAWDLPRNWVLLLRLFSQIQKACIHMTCAQSHVTSTFCSRYSVQFS